MMDEDQVTGDIIQQLSQPLHPDHIKTRQGAGKMQLSYLEGHHVIRQANTILGFNGWDRRTLECREVARGQRDGEKNEAHWMAKVEIYVHHLNVTRQGTGYGSGVSRNLGDAIELAMKEAETDAMKRAFVTLGDPFGLALYDKEQANVGTPEDPEATKILDWCIQVVLPESRDADKLRAWWGEAETQAVRQRLTPEQHDRLYAAFVKRGKTLTQQLKEAAE